ncbi:MAG: hypothetical protein R3B55_00275 [Candidatus Paceibacterota bacterium]
MFRRKIPKNQDIWEDEETEFYKITYDLSGIIDENAKTRYRKMGR